MISPYTRVPFRCSSGTSSEHTPKPGRPEPSHSANDYPHTLPRGRRGPSFPRSSRLLHRRLHPLPNFSEIRFQNVHTCQQISPDIQCFVPIASLLVISCLGKPQRLGFAALAKFLAVKSPRMPLWPEVAQSAHNNLLPLDRRPRHRQLF